MQEVEFRLLVDRLTHNGVSRHLSGQDWDRFADWTKRYHDLAWRQDNDDALLTLGRDIHTWLDGNEHWLAALRDLADGPVVTDFAVQGTPTEQDRRFLEVPWELAATDDTYLAADPAMMWAPVRRIGPTGIPPPPNPAHRLGVMFMAAAPRGQTSLDIEHEEAAILRATADLGLDLIVEDSGTLKEMTQAWNTLGSLDALHLSCHGLGGDTPFLALEIIPKAAFNRQALELSFYERYMKSAKTYRGLNRIEKVARAEAARCGLAALDALHVAAAFLLKADELFTTEKPGKPMYRTTLVGVCWLFR